MNKLMNQAIQQKVNLIKLVLITSINSAEALVEMLCLTNKK
jgi:hypothetical protein